MYWERTLSFTGAFGLHHCISAHVIRVVSWPGLSSIAGRGKGIPLQGIPRGLREDGTKAGFEDEIGRGRAGGRELRDNRKSCGRRHAGTACGQPWRCCAPGDWMSQNELVRIARNNQWLEEQGVPDMRAVWMVLHYGPDAPV